MSVKFCTLQLRRSWGERPPPLGMAKPMMGLMAMPCATPAPKPSGSPVAAHWRAPLMVPTSTPAMTMLNALSIAHCPPAFRARSAARRVIIGTSGESAMRARKRFATFSLARAFIMPSPLSPIILPAIPAPSAPRRAAPPGPTIGTPPMAAAIPAAMVVPSALPGCIRVTSPRNSANFFLGVPATEATLSPRL